MKIYEVACGPLSRKSKQTNKWESNKIEGVGKWASTWELY